MFRRSARVRAQAPPGVGGLCCFREPLLGLGLEPLLPRRLLGLDPLDLILDRREKLLPLGELRLDVLLVCRALRDDLLLLDAGLCELLLALLDFGLVGRDLLDDLARPDPRPG